MSHSSSDDDAFVDALEQVEDGTPRVNRFRQVSLEAATAALAAKRNPNSMKLVRTAERMVNEYLREIASK